MSLSWVLDSEHAEQPELFDNREIVWFNITDFFSNLESPWVVKNSHRAEEKIRNATDHFEAGGWMDPADVRGVVCDILKNAEPDDKRIMLEGRHRLIAANRLGETYAPFSVPLDMVDRLKSTIDVRSA